MKKAEMKIPKNFKTWLQLLTARAVREAREEDLRRRVAAKEKEVCELRRKEASPSDDK
jgi:hypothetical protein